MGGWFKFGGVEFFKIKVAAAVGEKKAWENRTAIYLGAAAGAEFIADIFLCPLEACRIRSVSDPGYASGLPGVAARLIKEEGVIRGFYSGFGPILFKQVPYTMAKFAVQGRAAEAMYNSMGTQPANCGAILNTGVSLGSIPSRMMNITKETGVIKLCTQGLGARCVMIGTLTALQFGIFDTVMRTLGAEKFHFHAPA